jgi:hypothetical protein
VSTGTPPTMTTVGADLYAALEPLAYADASLGWPLANYVSAIGLILEDAAVLVRTDDSGNDGWSAFADPARCPDSYLYTLAQWAGVRYPRRMSLTDLRELIGPHAPGVWRGTKAAILDAVQRWLEPGGLLYFEERADGDPYKLRIFTYTFDTLDEAAIQTELLNVIPAGLILDYEVREGPTWAQLHTSEGTWGAVKSNFATWRDVAIAPLAG